MIYIRTIAYNAKDTLRRTIDSVLGQTYTEFVYLVCDNGSTDNGATRKIVEEYAQKDTRIKAFYNKKNFVWEKENDQAKSFAKYLNDDDLFCQLDADDEYKPTFLSDCLLFMQANNLDIACCGSDFIDSESSLVAGIRANLQDLIIPRADFINQFIIYHKFMRTIWGKLYKARVLKSFEWNSDGENVPNAFGMDTYNNYMAFGAANKIGIMAKSLHKYYVSTSSVSYKYNPDRVECDQILYNCGMDYLKSLGEVSPQNRLFLLRVYFCSIYDTLDVISHASVSPLEKVRDIKKIFDCEYTKKALEINDNEYAHTLTLLKKVLFDWLLSADLQNIKEAKPLAADIILNIGNDIVRGLDKKFLMQLIEKHSELFICLINEQYEDALRLIDKHKLTLHFAGLAIVLGNKTNLSDSELLGLLAHIKASYAKYAHTLNIDAAISAIINKYPLLSCLNADMATAFCTTVCLILNGDPENALNAFLTTQDVEIDDNDADGYFSFAQNLTALADNADAYLYFKKAWVSYLIDSQRIDEAAAAVKELLLLTPDDPDLQDLARKI